MPKRHRTKLTKEEFEKAVVPSNHIIVELLREEDQAYTHGGTYLGMHEDSTWEEESETHSADIASVVGIARKLPNKLTFGAKEGDMPWDCDMVLKEGDMVWFNVIESKNSNEIVVDGTVHRVIPYRDVYVAKRRVGFEWDGKPYYDVIMLNGFVLLEQVPIPSMSELDTLDHGVYNDRGIVRYLGAPNRKYIRKEYTDSLPIKEGDLVFIQRGYQPFPLERRTYLSEFSKDKIYYVIQRRRLIFAL